MRLRDKVIVVTGSTSGIGAAIARRSVAEGARVLLHGLERELGAAVADELGDAATLQIDDLADPAAPGRIAAAALDAFGRIDGIVNCAALVARSSLETTTAAFFDRMLAINLRAPLLLIQAALPELKARRGAVLNIGSINAYCGEATLLDYSISKGGLMTLTRNLADSLASDGVRVVQLNVGWVLTEREDRFQIEEGQPADWAQNLPPTLAPSGRLLQPAEIAAAAIYWLSDEAGPISGAVVELEQYPVIGRNPTKQDP